MPNRLLALLLLAPAALLANAAPSSARGAVLSGAGMIAPVNGSPTSYSFTLTNTGDAMMAGAGNEPIACMRFLAAGGVQVSAVDQPAGAQTTLLPGQGFSATLTPPLAAHGSLSWTFTTSAPYPAGAGGTLTISPDCTNDSPAPVSGPAASPPPPATTTTSAPATTTTSAAPCHCVSLRVSLKPAGLATSAAELAAEGAPGARLAGLAAWSLRCSGGAGRCSGSVVLSAPPGERVRAFTAVSFVAASGPLKGRTLYRQGRPLALRLSCAGGCAGASAGTFFLRLDDAQAPGGRGKRGTILSVRLALACGGAGQETLRFAFSSSGALDPSRSSLG